MLTVEQQEAIDMAQDYCDEYDKSTEFMLQYCADSADCEIEDVVEYFQERSNHETNR